MKKTSRRNFIASSATVGVGSLLAAPSLNRLFAAEKNGIVWQGIGFDQQPLTFAYNALEPSIDAATMEIHYSKHAAAYCKNLQEAAAAEGVNTKKPIEEVLKNISKYSVKMRNNAGGHYNHELFWKSLSPTPAAQPGTKLENAFVSDFDSIEEFKKQFSDAAKARFGSGWAWLIVNEDKKLQICTTPNQDNPLMDIAEVKGYPLFGLDVWEHAYYLQYQNRRPAYIENFWKVLDWNFVSQRFDAL